MTKIIDQFRQHADSPNPGFACFAAGDQTESIRLYAPVKISLQKHASRGKIKRLSKWIEDPDGQFHEFYSSFNGASLYIDANGDAVGLEFLSLSKWKKQTRQMRKRHLCDIEDFDGDIRFLTDAMAFAVVPHSGNYFSVISSGENCGKIYYVDHDDWNYEPFSQSLDEFIIRVTTDPAQFLVDIGAYARYSDGQTDTQWVPKKFVSDLGKIAP